MLAGALVHRLQGPAPALRVAAVHAQQVAREERGLVPAGAGADLEVDVADVGGVGRYQPAAQLLFETAAFLLGLGQLLPGQGSQLSVAVALVHHLPRLGDAGQGVAVTPVVLDERAQLGVLPRELAKARLILRRRGFGEQPGELF